MSTQLSRPAFMSIGYDKSEEVHVWSRLLRAGDLCQLMKTVDCLPHLMSTKDNIILMFYLCTLRNMGNI